MKLNRCKVEKSEHDFTTGNKQASNSGQKVKRLSEAIQKLLTTDKDRQQDLSSNLLQTHHRAEDGAGKREIRLYGESKRKFRLF